MRRALARLAAQVSVRINERPVTVPTGTTLINAAHSAGLEIPTLCYKPGFKPRGTCRLCLVENDRTGRLVPSCATVVGDGDSFTTDSPALEEFRRDDLKLLLRRHPDSCMTCAANGDCKLQTQVRTHNLEQDWPKALRSKSHHEHAHRYRDHSSPAILRDLDKCIECGLCVDACAAQAMDIIGFAERGSDAVPITVFDKELSDTDCISCGQCTWVCPVGALVEVPDWQRVLHQLDTGRRKTVVQTAPATRVAISEEFGLDPGTISTGRLVAALRACGFDYVFDTNFTADLTIMEEGSELLARVAGKGGPLPMLTSCCPGWINVVELQYPELIPHLSTAKSPQQMHAAVTKSIFAKAAGLEDEPYTVSLMPCTAKKDEAVRPGMRGDVDAVLTTRELAQLMRHRGIHLAHMPEAEYDDPLGQSTGAAQIFGASGGVMEAALRTALALAGLETERIDFHEVRGLHGIKEAEIPGFGRVAACSGMAQAKRLLADPDWKDRYVFVEVMACKGGCLGGGGEPKSDDPNILRRRMESIYQIDRNSPRRKSHENPSVKQLYKDHLGAPLGELSHHLLHTTYAPRHSERDYLWRFLDAVDRRSSDDFAHILTEDAVWVTNHPDFGTLTGPAEIARFVTTTLPPNPDRHRHRLAAPTGLAVHTPTGDHVDFAVELDTARRRIRRIERIVKET